MKFNFLRSIGKYSVKLSTIFGIFETGNGFSTLNLVRKNISLLPEMYVIWFLMDFYLLYSKHLYLNNERMYIFLNAIFEFLVFFYP